MASVNVRNPAGGILSLAEWYSPCTLNSRKCSPFSCGRSSTSVDCSSSSSSSSSSTSERLLLRLGVSQSRCFFSGSVWFSFASQCNSSGRLRTVFQCSNGVGVFPTGNGSALIRNGAPVVDLNNRKKDALSILVEPVAEELSILNESLHTIVGTENRLLSQAAEQIFSAGGKRLRPALVFLVSRATSQLAGEGMKPEHWRLAQVIEMIHTASLIHDDVLDESDTRRGKKTVHTTIGTRLAILAGDFMFAQSSWYLANLDNLEVIKLISQVIKDFASGEIKQATSLFDCDVTLQDYLEKSYYKTASLIAASTRSAAIFSGMNPSVCDQMYDYGLHLGMAFQVVDDILDFTQSSEQLGKPAGSDLAKGNLTAPVLFALQSEPELRELINTEFTDEGSLDAAIALVSKGGGIEKARQLAKERGSLALMNLDCLPKSPLRQSLEGIVDYVLERIF